MLDKLSFLHACCCPAFTVELMKNQRWLLGSGGRSASPWWRAVDVVSPSKQLLFLQRLLFSFQIRRKQVKHVNTARLSVEAWEMLVETSCLGQYVLEEMQEAHHDDHSPIFEPAMLEKARRRLIEGMLSKRGIDILGYSYSQLPDNRRPHPCSVSYPTCCPNMCCMLKSNCPSNTYYFVLLPQHLYSESPLLSEGLFRRAAEPRGGENGGCPQ